MTALAILTLMTARSGPEPIFQKKKADKSKRPALLFSKAGRFIYSCCLSHNDIDKLARNGDDLDHGLPLQ
jgi:hypothetical protein